MNETNNSVTNEEIKKINILDILCILLIFTAMIIIIGFILKTTWNNVLPDVVGVKEITLYQAIGLMIISSILFGGKCSYKY